MIPYVITILILVIIIILLIVKLYLIKKSTKEITRDFSFKIKSDTNTELRISSRDKDIKNLTTELNKELVVLKKERDKYIFGNSKLTDAITNVSHDIRTPLTAICGYLDMLEKTTDENKRAEYILVMKDRAALMRHLTDELFYYSLITTDKELELEDICINEALEESIISFYPELTSKSIEPVINITNNKIIKKTNKEAVLRIFSNLINNACKYSDKDLYISLNEDCLITFKNKAKNLSPVQVEQLFNRFYTVEVAHNSTGLGLSITKTLVERLGGKVKANYLDGSLIIEIYL